MFETIKRIYARTGNEEVVRKAVARGWITGTQYTEITGDTYPSEQGDDQ